VSMKAWPVVFLAAAVGGFVGSWLEHGPRSDRSTTLAPSPDLARLEDGLAELSHQVRAALDDRAMDAIPISEPQAIQSEASLLETFSEAVDRRLTQLEGFLRTLVLQVSSETATVVAEGVSFPKDEVALADLLVRFESDRKRTLGEYFCWTPGQWYRRFGAPDQVLVDWPEDGVLSWVYLVDHSSPEPTAKVMAAFKDGLLIRIGKPD